MNTLLFKPVDRIPLIEWNIRKATMREWVSRVIQKMKIKNPFSI